MIQRFVHLLPMGQQGTGKSTLLNTLPDPKLVLMFDPLGKEMPYLADCERVEEKTHTVKAQKEDITYQVLEGYDAQDILRVRIEFFHDHDATKPKAYKAFKARMGEVFAEVNEARWSSVVLDSLTFCELTCRKMYEHDVAKDAQDSRRWYLFTKNDIEQVVMISFAGLRCHVGVACHIDEDKDEYSGMVVRHPKAPGSLRHSIGAGFEVVRTYLVAEKGKPPRYMIQTMPGDGYYCSTQRDLPNPCEPDFEAISRAPYRKIVRKRS